MNRIIVLLFFIFGCFTLSSQNVFWVFFTDKAGATFNPYEYFDVKAIERRLTQQIPIYDSTDFPLNTFYVHQVEGLSEEVIGETRWFNALAVQANPENIKRIANLPFVKEIQSIQTYPLMSAYENMTDQDVDKYLSDISDSILTVHKQLARMQGQYFHEAGIDGKGIRIAVFDGGFPRVDVHPAFKHLRDHNLIIKTWNFPLKKENVYGWSSHGTMTLSCIAGICYQEKQISCVQSECSTYVDKNEKLGLATGAEFLLARTEISIEPGREEVWWMQAMEWADKHGADIISSSLGYNDARHKVSDMDGKSCLVSRAANMAAAKGMLVCNSMGNDGDRKSWKTLIAPADADSVLSVGGIDHNDTHASFSSYGPTADGRLKPNVCAYAVNCKVAKPSQKEENSYDFVNGTSFSCPLVAGFAACAWQKHRNLNVMELKREIERSADFYPYFDYAFGYGVPQASYFMSPTIKAKIPTFLVEEDEDWVIVKPFECNNTLFYHIQNENGSLDLYSQVDFKTDDEIKSNIYFSGEIDNNKRVVKIHKRALWKKKELSVYYKGYVLHYRLSEEDIARIGKDSLKSYTYTIANTYMRIHEVYTDRTKISTYGVNAVHYVYPYLHLGFFTSSDTKINYAKSPSFEIGARYKANIAKWYSLGASLGYNVNSFHLKNKPSMVIGKKIIQKLNVHMLSVELHQRFRLFPGEQLGFGCYIDMGLYGAWDFAYQDIYIEKVRTYKKEIKTLKYLPFSNIKAGVSLRLGYGLFAVYGRYRLDELLMKFNEIYYPLLDMPRLEVGLQLTIPTSL